MDSIDSAEFSPINFHTTMETPNRPCEEKAPLLPPRTSTPYSYLRKKVFKPAVDEAKAGAVPSGDFLFIIVVLKLLTLAFLAQAGLSIAGNEFKRNDLRKFSLICVVAVPVLLLALAAIRTRRSALLLPYLILQIASNLVWTVAVANIIRNEASRALSQPEFIVPVLTALLIPYAFWSYITFIALHQVFAMRPAKKQLKGKKDVERPTTDEEEEDVIVFERPRSTGRKVRFADFLGRKEL